MLALIGGSVGVEASVSVEAIAVAELPPEVNGGATLSGYRVSLTGAGAVGVGDLRSAQPFGSGPGG